MIDALLVHGLAAWVLIVFAVVSTFVVEAYDRSVLRRGEHLNRRSGPPIMRHAFAAIEAVGASPWSRCAPDALVIPVRVDQHSMQALKLALSMLKNPTMDFLRLNAQAGITKIPKMHAIVMTHCGWNRQAAFTRQIGPRKHI